jgi:CRISPR-associated endonuclease Cas2
MYAITFDLNTKCLKDNYDNGRSIPQVDEQLLHDDPVALIGGDELEPDVKKAWQGAYYTIRTYLESKGFQRIQGSVYAYQGKEEIEQYTVYRYLMKFAKMHPWFVSCTKDLRIFKIEEYSRENVILNIKEDLD